jgi:DNA-binding CsgD family transcriptional regulator
LVVGTPTSRWPFAAKNSPTLADLIADGASFETMRKRFGDSLKKSAVEGGYELEHFFPSVNNGTWMFITAAPIRGIGGDITSVIHTIQDITARKQLQEVLQRAKQELEIKVQERTADLEEANTALRVMLQVREADKKVLATDMLHNITQLVMPHLDKLKACRLNERQAEHVEIIQKTLDSLVAPMLNESVNRALTPAELRITNLIRQGKTTKEISEILNVGLKTIDFHRDKIRKKMGLKNCKKSLRDFLLNEQHSIDVD